MNYFPLFVRMRGQSVLVVGGGVVAARKVRVLAKSSAELVVVAPRLAPAMVELIDDGTARHLARAFQPDDVRGHRLVVAATDDADTNRAVAGAARAAGVLVNAVDQPGECEALMPAIVDRDPVCVAIGTEGTAPVLARTLRARISALLPQRLGTLARAAGELRSRIAAQVPAHRRRRVWERLLTGPFASAVVAGESERAQDALEHSLREPYDDAGFVSLVGCGPGDPELLTLKALRILQTADVLVVDRLVHPEILEHARRDAEVIYVGKTPGEPSMTQAQINRILVARGQRGERVARLKGGDPLLFGRLCEELQALQEAGIAHEIVPGVTAAFGCAAAVGLPLTARGEVRSITLLTGRSAAGRELHDWQALLRPGAAFAIYMGVGTAPELRAQLLDAGASPSMPAVVVENGTRPEARCFATTLDDLVECIDEHAIVNPALIYLGLRWPGQIPGQAVHFRRAAPLQSAELSG